MRGHYQLHRFYVLGVTHAERWAGAHELTDLPGNQVSLFIGQGANLVLFSSNNQLEVCGVQPGELRERGQLRPLDLKSLQHLRIQTQLIANEHKTNKLQTQKLGVVATPREGQTKPCRISPQQDSQHVGQVAECVQRRFRQVARSTQLLVRCRFKETRWALEVKDASVLQILERQGNVRKIAQ